MIPNVKPTIPEEDIEEILADMKTVLETRRVMLGGFLQRFEEQYSAFIGTKYAVGLNGCIAGLQILFQYFDVEQKEVVLPTMNFISAANAVLFAGGKPVFCDTEPNSVLPGLEQIRSVVTEKTRGIVLTHITGLMNPALPQIAQYAKENGLFLIEDASHAHGSEIEGVKAGALCDAAVFSMYATKVITSGAGGVLTTDDPEIDAYARSARHHGQGKNLFDCKTIGSGWYLPELNAVLACHQTRRLPSWLEKRWNIAERYNQAFEKLPHITVERGIGKCAHYKYQVIIDTAERRTQLKQQLEAAGIKTGVVYDPPIHLQPVYREKFGYTEGMYPNTEDIAKRILSLPMFVEMTDEEVETVIAAVTKLVQ